MKHRSIEQALDAVLREAPRLEVERCALADAHGRALAEPVAADRDQPPFDRAMMDGFAVRSADVAAAPVTLPVVATIAAGQPAEPDLPAGAAIRIMTGAPVPSGADAVQMIENTDGGANERVRIDLAVAAGRHVAARGEDIRAGEIAVPAGARLNSARLGVCWTMGAAEVAVYRRPRVVILSTGDELVELAETPLPHQIRDSNRATIGARVEAAGGVVVRAELVRDTMAATREAIARGLRDADVLLLSGGVSAGDYDYVGPALEAEGVTPIFYKVHMRPGKPLWFGRRGAVTVFGLPGNPVSSLVCTRIFVQPHLRKRAGQAVVCDPVLRLPLLEPTQRTGPRPAFRPARVEWGLGVRTLDFRGSGDLRGFSEANALVFLPERSEGFAVGTVVETHLDEESLRG